VNNGQKREKPSATDCILFDTVLSSWRSARDILFRTRLICTKLLHGDDVRSFESHTTKKVLKSLDDVPCIVIGPFRGLHRAKASDHVVCVGTAVIRGEGVVDLGCLNLNELMIAGRVRLYAKEASRELYTAQHKGERARTAIEFDKITHAESYMRSAQSPN
jgi:hypothetical protein